MVASSGDGDEGSRRLRRSDPGPSCEGPGRERELQPPPPELSAGTEMQVGPEPEPVPLPSRRLLAAPGGSGRGALGWTGSRVGSGRVGVGLSGPGRGSRLPSFPTGPPGTCSTETGPPGGWKGRVPGSCQAEEKPSQRGSAGLQSWGERGAPALAALHVLARFPALRDS